MKNVEAQAHTTRMAGEKKERLIAKEKAGKRTRNGVKKRKNNEIARMRQKDILLHLVCIRSSDINYNQMFSAEF